MGEFIRKQNSLQGEIYYLLCVKIDLVQMCLSMGQCNLFIIVTIRKRKTVGQRYFALKHFHLLSCNHKRKILEDIPLF